MERTAETTLKNIFSDVLADLAFMFTDDLDDQTSRGAFDRSGEALLETTISYQGPTCGMLRLRCPPTFAVLLAANLLGADPEDEDSSQKACDAVGEFMNIVCGQFITAVHGTEQVFDLTLPQTRELFDRTESPPFDHPDRTVRCALVVEGHPVELACTVGTAAGTA